MVRLTQAERRAIVDAANGRSDAESAALHGLSVYTIKDQRQQVLRKMGTARMTGAVAEALRCGLVPMWEVE